MEQGENKNGAVLERAEKILDLFERHLCVFCEEPVEPARIGLGCVSCADCSIWTTAIGGGAW